MNTLIIMSIVAMVFLSGVGTGWDLARSHGRFGGRRRRLELPPATAREIRRHQRACRLDLPVIDERPAEGE